MFVLIGACLLLAALNAYQAMTGRRVSKRPSQRTDRQMRRQSAIAAVALGVLGILALAGAIAK
jgi:hypothetical protein